jgi:isoquinoline 1-oxidoreductase
VSLEIERYELFEPAPYRFEVDRRDFLRACTALGGGLLVVAAMPAEKVEAGDQESGRAAQGAQAPSDVAAWIHVDSGGRITAFTGKVEVGQNARTSLAQTVADELAAPLASVAMVMGDTARTPFDQGTFGSRTTPAMAPVLARAASAAREALIELAAARWQTDRTTLSARDGRVHARDGRSAGYGELAEGRALAGVVLAPASPAWTRARWSSRGTPAAKVNSRDIVTGRHAFTPDLERTGVLHGRVIRPPALGATPRRVDLSAARAMPGVVAVEDNGFIGVAAPSERELARAVAVVRVEWTDAPPQPSSETVYEHLRRGAPPAGEGRGSGRGGSPRALGDVAAARASAARTFDAAYRIPYIAHVPLEPRAALAEWTEDGVTVWCGTQRPWGVRDEVARAFGLASERVRVIVPDTGSAYGGKHTGEHAVEAARLARAARRPVKLVYTRPEEFMFGYARPAGVIEVRASVDAAGRLSAWEFDNWNSGGSALNTPYAVPNRREAFHAADSPLRQGSYRGLAATANTYVREMHMDAIARALGRDAVQFRLAHLGEQPRLRAVLESAARKAGWPRPSQPDRAVGIACGTEKGSYVATVAEVEASASSAAPFRVTRLVVAFECGSIVNPDGLLHQVEGAVVQGLGGALFERLEFERGRLLNGTLSRYRVPRFKDVPPIEVVLMDRPDLQSAGAGETPIIAVAPAIGSAVRAFGRVAEELPVRLVTQA